MKPEITKGTQLTISGFPAKVERINNDNVEISVNGRVMAITFQAAEQFWEESNAQV